MQNLRKSSVSNKITFDLLPSECLFEILRRVVDGKERYSCGLVSKKWLMLLSMIRRDEQKDAEEFDKSGGSLTRRLKGKKATDVRLAAIGLGTPASRGGLGELSVLGNGASKVTDFGLKAVARCSPSLTSITLSTLSSVGDEGVAEIANNCHLLEKLEFCECSAVTDKSLIAIADNCSNLTSLALKSCSSIGNQGLQAIGKRCSNLISISIKHCSLVGDKGIACLVSSTGYSLLKNSLKGLNISDMSLAVIGHYGISLTDLRLSSLHNVTEKGFWVMGNGQGLQKLRSFDVNACTGVTDVGLEAVGKGFPNLKRFSVQKADYVSDNGVVAFANAALSLETLILEECRTVTQFGIFGLLLNCATLKTLSLTKCSGIKDLPMIISLSVSPCNSLKSLSVRNCPEFGNYSLALLGQLCHQIQKVVLNGLHGITDKGLTLLIQNSEAGLTKVDLSGCLGLTYKVVSKILLAHGATLEVLILHGCRLITNSSMVSVAQNCKILRELDVSESAITDNSIAALAYANQLNLKVLSISGCAISNKSLPFLKNLGESLMGLNMKRCHGVSSDRVHLLETELYECDILT